MGVEGPEGWEVGGEVTRHNLEKAERVGEVREPMLAEIAQAHSFWQIPRYNAVSNIGHKDLTAVSSRSDAGGSVDIHTNIPSLPGYRLARVEPDAHLRRSPIGPRLRLHGPLRRYGGKQGISRPRKGREHGIPLSVHHLTLAFLDGGTEQAVVSCESFGITLTQALEQPRRALDIGEEEGDRPGRQGSHGSLRQPV
jgi:hypothetical protein